MHKIHYNSHCVILSWRVDDFLVGYNSTDPQQYPRIRSFFLDEQKKIIFYNVYNTREKHIRQLGCTCCIFICITYPCINLSLPFHEPFPQMKGKNSYKNPSKWEWQSRYDLESLMLWYKNANRVIRSRSGEKKGTSVFLGKSFCGK